MNTVRVAVMSLGEDHSVERSIEFDIDTHVRLLALDLQILNLRLVARLANRPLIFRGWANGTTLRWVASKTAGWWRQESRARWNVVGWKWDLSFIGIR